VRAGDAERRLRDYARLAIEVGVNVQPGQRLAINAYVEHYPFARAAAEAAYERGASFVDVLYTDQHVRHAHVLHAEEQNLGYTPPWLVERIESLAADGGALLSIAGTPDPDLFSDLDGARIAASQMRALRAATLRLTDGTCNWAILAYPTESWATTIFGEPDVERLWEAIAFTVRLDEPDPVAAWQEHTERLRARALALDAQQLDALRYLAPGTELTVGLHPDGRWESADDLSIGIRHVPNMPTEEVFTTPDARRVDGFVRATYPLLLQGVIVRGLEVRFAGGRVTDVRADEGEELMRAYVKTDDGASRLGEVALVDRNSRVGQTGLVFYETLFDENASSHIALGSAIAQAVPVEGLTPEERHARGVNHSGVHTDFMIGSDELNVWGVKQDGTEVLILDRGDWVLPQGSD
jgi:aminopeptidase